MAVFGKYTATEPRYYPTLDLQATTGVIVDFTVINGGSYPVDGRWTSDAGPANYVPPSPSGSTPLTDHGLLANRPAASALPNQRYIATDTVQEFWSDGSSWIGPFGGTGGGSSLTPTAVKTANYTAAASDFVPVDTTSNAVTVTLPTTPADKTQVGVKHVVRGGTNTVTIAAGGTDRFNVAGGSTTASLVLLREAATFQYVTATGLWYALSNDLPLSQLDTRYAAAGSAANGPAWATSHAYTAGDLATYNGLVLVAASTHTSGTFATDYAAGKWLPDPTKTIFDVRAFGAKVDGRYALDAVTTSGSAVTTSATAAYTAGDVGKAAQIQSQAGVTLATTTVLSYQSATQVTLNANASATTTGAVLVIGTDDTAAVQAAVTAAVAAGGGTVYFPQGVCLWAGAQQTGGTSGTAYSGQVILPNRALTVGQTVVRLLGATPTPEVFWAPTAGDAMPWETGGSIVHSTATSGNVIDVSSTSTHAGNFSNIQLNVEDLLFRLPNNPQAGGLRLDRALNVSVKGVTVGVAVATALTLAQPTGSTTNVVGIKFPSANNGAFVACRDSQVYGFPTGITHSEHFVGDNVAIYNCVVGIAPELAYHMSNYTRVGLYENITQIKPTNTCNIYGTIALESKSTGGWWGVVWDIDDPNVYMSGSIGYVRFGDSGNRSDYIYARTSLNLDLWCIATGGPHSLSPTKTLDTFTRENSTRMATATSGQVWYPATNPSGAPGTGGPSFGITGNKAYAVNGASFPNQYLALIYNHGPYFDVTNHTISADITTSSGTTQAGLCGRFVNGNTYIYAVIIVSGGTKKVTLGKNVGGSFTTLGNDSTITYAVSTTYTMTMQCTATQIIISVNGTPYITYALTGGEQTTFNGSARCGLAAWGGAGGEDSGSRWANFKVTSPAPAAL